MVRTLLLLVTISLATVLAEPRATERIVGGSLTTISQYPYAAAALYSYDFVTYFQSCGGSILNTRSILTAAHCYSWDAANRWRVRVGSSYANSGGIVHNVAQIINHPGYSAWTGINDVSVLRLSAYITFSTLVAPASIAGNNYNVADNQAVWGIGWGYTSANGPASEQLQHVQIWTVNINTCRQRYQELGRTITNTMLCAGWLDVGGRDQCIGDSGSPLIHSGVVVGVRSFGEGCGLARYPGVTTRVSTFVGWIQANA